MNYLGKRKMREGVVVSDKMDKTVMVAVQTRKIHPLYKKAITLTKNYMAHDAKNACKVGDKVRIVETRPLSKRKRWRVIEILSKAEAGETEQKQRP